MPVFHDSHLKCSALVFLWPQANTKAFPNVHVECTGLWARDANLQIVPSDDNLDWGWRTLEVGAAAMALDHRPCFLQDLMRPI